jgi:hypothetical protein
VIAPERDGEAVVDVEVDRKTIIDISEDIARCSRTKRGGGGKIKFKLCRHRVGVVVVRVEKDERGKRI